MHRRFALATVSVLAVAAPATAGVWSRPGAFVRPPVPVSEPQLVVNPRGDAFVTWIGGNRVWGSIRPVSTRAWSAPQALSPRNQTVRGPRIAANGTGHAVAAWYVPGPPPPPDGAAAVQAARVQAALRPAGQRWGAAQTLALDAFTPDVAMDSRGNAAIVWVSRSGTIKAGFRPAGKPWGAIRTLAQAGPTGGGPSVALDSSGNAVAVWHAGGIGAGVFVETSRRAAGGSWEPAQRLGSAAFAPGPQVALDRAGNATVAWAGQREVQVSTRAASGGWQPPIPVEAPGSDPDGVRLVMAPDGRAVVVWSQFVRPVRRIMAAVRAAGSLVWGPSEALSGPSYFGHSADVALGRTGKAAAIWIRSEDTGFVSVEASVFGLRGNWGPPVQLQRRPAIYPLQVDADRAGNIVALWLRSAGTLSLPVVRAYDDAGPVFARVRIPRVGRVGVRMRFSVSPFDVWSGLRGAPVWSFGDGSSARGLTVIHAYSRPGRFRIVLRQSDSLGNRSTAARTIRVNSQLAP